jgi:hypothetical protein
MNGTLGIRFRCSVVRRGVSGIGLSCSTPNGSRTLSFLSCGTAAVYQMSPLNLASILSCHDLNLTSEQPPDILVRVFDHRRVGRVVLKGLPPAALLLLRINPKCGDLPCVLLDLLRFRLQRCVNCVKRQECEERPITVLFNETDCFVCQAFGQVFIFRTVSRCVR